MASTSELFPYEAKQNSVTHDYAYLCLSTTLQLLRLLWFNGINQAMVKGIRKKKKRRKNRTLKIHLLLKKRPQQTFDPIVLSTKMCHH